MKPEPKFVPGERVILDAKTRPHLSGEYYIDEVKFFAGGRRVGEYKVYPAGFCYQLIGIQSMGWGFVEESLRKLPPNTPTTFDECIFKPEKVKS